MTSPKMNDTLRQELDDLARACRILAMEGHEDVAQGHLSLRDPTGRGIWLKRRAIGLSEVHGPEDFTLLDWDGNILEGTGGKHNEWPIHTHPMLARPEIRVCGHTHPFHATLCSALDDEFVPFNQDGCRVRGQQLPRYTVTSELVLTHEMGKDVAAALGDAWALLMRNHGVAFYGETVKGAMVTGIFLERACRGFFTLKASGARWGTMTEKEIATLGRLFSAERFLNDTWGFFSRALDRFEGVA